MLRTFLRKTVLHSFKGGILKDFNSMLRQSYGSAFSLNKIFISSRTSLPTKTNSRSRNSMNNSQVKHNKSQEYFYIEAPDCRPILEYELRKKVVTILNTEVPEKCSGRGYGKQLADASLQWIAKNNFRLNIECEFVKHYVEKYRPEFKKFIIN